MMFGLILDYYWSSSNQDPVNVTLVGTLDQLRSIRHVDPSNSVAGWRRAEVVPVEAHDVTSDFGGRLAAHICARRDAYLLAVEELRGAE
jgi:hypothetical protein